MMYCEVIYCSSLYVYKLEEIFTTAEENEAVVSLFCGLGISLKDEICIETEVNLWGKKGQQIFSKGKVQYRYTTLTSIVAAVDSIFTKRQKNKNYSFTVS